MNDLAKLQIEKIKVICERIKPLVVIRCITYNHEPYIRDALEGFVTQKTKFPFVAIVHDDASTDGTAAIIKEYAEKYPHVILPIYEKENQYSKRDNSLIIIMNEACKVSGVRYIALCEGDDYWTDPQKLQKQVDFLESHPDYGMCYTRVDRLDQVTGNLKDQWGGPNTTFETLIMKNTIPTLTTLFRTDLYKDYISDIKPERKKWKMGDYPLWLYISQRSRIFFFPEVTGIYRILEESGSHTRSIERRYAFDKNYKAIAEYFLNNQKENITNDIINRFLWSKHSLLLPMGHIVNDEEELREAYIFFKNKKINLRLFILTLPNFIIKLPLKIKYYISDWRK